SEAMRTCEHITRARGLRDDPAARIAARARSAAGWQPPRMPIHIERHTSPALFPPPGYSHAVVSRGGATVWSAGGVPLDADGVLVGSGALTAQTQPAASELTM